MSYYGEDDDDWDYRDRERDRRRRPSAHRNRTEGRRSVGLLNPDNIDNGGLYRTRSQGGRPLPQINVYTDVIQDANQRQASRSPPYTAVPDARGRRDRLGDGLADDIADLALENRRLRSRSRGRSDAAYTDGRSDYYEWELRRKEKELRDMERRASRDRERDRIEQEFEVKRLRDEAKRKAEESASKEERRRIISEYERQQREDEEDRIEEEQRIKEKLEREKREAKEKEEREWNEFLRKQKEKEEKDKEEKKKKEEEFEQEMRKRLARFGIPPDQIEIMVKEEKEKQGFTRTTRTTTTELQRWQPNRAPVYAKIHTKYLSVDTLRYYDIPWEYDRTDRNYLIVKREMDSYETDVLFEHTKRLRAGKLLLEAPKDEKEYAWYRKRDRSSSRVRKLGILEYKR